MSTYLDGAVQSAAHSVTKVHYPLPSPFQAALKILEKGHQFLDFYHHWKWVQKDQGKALISLGAINALDYLALFFSSSLGCSMAFTAVRDLSVGSALFFKCAQDLIDGHAKVYYAYQSLKGAFQGEFPLGCNEKMAVVELKASPPFDFSTWAEIQVKMAKGLLYLKRILKCTLKVFVALFKLSKRYREVYLISQSDSTARQQALLEACADYHKYLKRLEKDQLFLQEQSAKAYHFFKGVLSKVTTKDQSESWVKNLESTVSSMSKSLELTLSVAQQIGRDTFSTFYKHDQVTGISFTVPENFSSPYKTKFMKPKELIPYPTWKVEPSPLMEKEVQELNLSHQASPLKKIVIGASHVLSYFVRNKINDSE